MEINLNKNEIIENIPEYNLKIIQNNVFFKYGVDSIALAKFAASFNTKNTIIDICSGSGIVGLVYLRLIEDKFIKNPNYKKIKKIYFLEKQKYFAELNEKNIKINDIKNANIINLDIKDPNVINNISPNSVDIILINPPYYLASSSLKSSGIEKSIAKFEDDNFLDHFFKLSKTILKDRGEIYMVNRPERLVDIFYISRKHKIEPKIMKNIISDPSKKHSLVLLKFVKNGNNFLKIEDPFIISNNW